MHSTESPPHRVVETIQRFEQTTTAPINAYWLSVTGNRNDYAARLRPLLRTLKFPVLIVRDRGFTNPNSLMVDLVHLLEHNRTEFLAELGPMPAMNRLGMVLLSHGELVVGQSSSPAILPEWLPHLGNMETMCFITDISRRVEVPLKAEEIDSPRVNSALFGVEEALVRRLLEVHHIDASRQDGFFERIRRRSDPGWSGFLGGANRSRQGIHDVRAFRPERRQGESVVSRLWQLSRSLPPDQLSSAASDLAAALGADTGHDLRPVRATDSLFAVLARTPGPEESVGQRLCRSILTTVPVACQFVTCVVHSDRYQPFPIGLLTTVVDDLSSALSSIETALIHLAEQPAREPR